MRSFWIRPMAVLLMTALAGSAMAQQAGLRGQQRFEIYRIIVEGAPSLKPEQIARVVAPFTGKDRSDLDVQASLEALRKAHLDAGLKPVGVLLPDQDVVQGVVRFSVLDPPAERSAGAEAGGRAALRGVDGYLTKSGWLGDMRATPVPAVVVTRNHDSADGSAGGVPLFTVTFNDGDRAVAVFPFSNAPAAEPFREGKSTSKAPAESAGEERMGARRTPVQTASQGSPPAKDSAPPAQEAAGGMPRFEIQRFEVEGSSLLTREEVERAVAPFTGKQKDFGDVQRALETLQKTYLDRGFAAVQVLLPEQELQQGVVRFRVVEAKVSKITIQGNQFFDDENIRNSVPALKEGQTPSSIRIGENLRLANENPAKQTTVILRSGETQEEIDATIRVADEKQWKASLTLDNTGNPQTGNNRVSAGYRHSNFFNRDHVLTLQFITSLQKADKVTIFGMGYKIPLYARGDSIEMFAGGSNVDSGKVQDLFNVSGQGTIFGLRYNHLLPKAGEFYEQKLVYGVDYRAYQNQVIFGVENLIPDITVHPASITYSGQWRFPTSEANFYVTGMQNIFPGGNDAADSDFKARGQRPGDAALGIAGARAGYRILRYGFSYNKAFTGDWLIRVSYSAQQTSDALVAGEQFGLGGAETVRGFLEREVASDQGYLGKVEFYMPDLADKIGFKNGRARLLVFYDFGGVERNSPLPEELRSSFISSAGFGLRASVGEYLSLRTDLAQVLNAGGSQSKGDGRLHFSLSYIF